VQHELNRVTEDKNNAIQYYREYVDSLNDFNAVEKASKDRRFVKPPFFWIFANFLILFYIFT
jgi:hypothetical protein